MVYRALSTQNLTNLESPIEHQLQMGMRFLSSSLYMLKSAYSTLLLADVSLGVRSCSLIKSSSYYFIFSLLKFAG